MKHLDDEAAAALLTQPEEFALIKKLAEFDDMLMQAKDQLAPYLLCRYLLDTAKLLNSYYASVHIMKSEEQTKIARIMLLEKVRGILEKCMNLV